MSKSIKWYINVAISLGIMWFFRYIPAPEPMTSLGMTTIGIFLGAIYGWCTTNMIWPSIAALILFGLTGAAGPVGGMWGKVMSNNTIGLCFWLMLTVALLKNTGLIEWIANWSVTRPFTKGKPWLLMIVIFACTLACASVMAEVAVTLAFWALVWAICDEVGIEKGSHTATWMTFSVAIIVGFGGYLLPFKPAVFTNFGFLAAASNGAYDGAYSYAAWTALTLSVALVMIAVFLLISRYIIRVDLSKLANYVPDESRKRSMTKKQKVSLLLFALLFLGLMVPSFLPKAWPVAQFLNKFGNLAIAMVIIGIATCIRVDGEPLLTFDEIARDNVVWNIIFMFGTALTLCLTINSPDAGVSAWLIQVLNPIFGHMSPYLFLVCYFLVALVITNFINNAVVGAIMVPVSYTLCMALGLNPIACCACIILFADFGVMLPSASPTGALIHNSNGWIAPKYLYAYCLLGCVLFAAASLFIGWPLANVLFPFGG